MNIMIKVFLVMISFLLTIIILSGITVQTLYRDAVVAHTELTPPASTGIIFGAGINPDGTPREMLEARVVKGIELLNEGRVSMLLFTGDGGSAGHNEPEAMKAYALGKGVGEENIILDIEGHTTFDSCENAARIFKIEKAILVTQKFHLPRALYLCNNLGIESIGVRASSTDRLAEKTYAQREYLASIKAWTMINIPKLRPLFQK